MCITCAHMCACACACHTSVSMRRRCEPRGPTGLRGSHVHTYIHTYIHTYVDPLDYAARTCHRKEIDQSLRSGVMRLMTTRPHARFHACVEQRTQLDEECTIVGSHKPAPCGPAELHECCLSVTCSRGRVTMASQAGGAWTNEYARNACRTEYTPL